MAEILNDNLVLTNNYSVTSADADMFARLRPGALVNSLIQSAISSADSLGFGFKDLKQHKLFWVLSRLTIEINKPLTWNQSLKVETWPKDLDGLMYLRDFMVYGPEDEVVAKATSGWLAVDYETKRPKVVEGTTSEFFTLLKEKHALENHPQKLQSQQEGVTKIIKPEYSDIDLNKHVTSTRYIDWMTDVLPFGLLQNNYPRLVSINYLRETLLGDEIQLIYLQQGTSFLFEGFNVTKNTPAFRGKLDF